jgi:hypothetical protein
MACRSIGTRDKAQAETQTNERESMNASKLTAEQLEWLCRVPLTLMLDEAKQTKREAKSNSPTIVYANARIEKVSEIFKAVGYWQESDKVGN